MRLRILSFRRVGALVGMLAVAAAAFFLRPYPEYFSSPSAPRDMAKWKGTRYEYFSHALYPSGRYRTLTDVLSSWERKEKLIRVPYRKATVEEKWLKVWPEESKRLRLTGSAMPWTLRGENYQAGEGGQVNLPGGRLEWVAYGLSIPDESSQGKMTYYQPSDHQRLTMDALLDLGLDSEWLLQKNENWKRRPVLRMLLRRKGSTAPFSRPGALVYDAKTGASVSQTTSISNQGEWALIDAMLGIWHDAPLEIAVQLPAGSPRKTPLDLRNGAKSTAHGQFAMLHAMGHGTLDEFPVLVKGSETYRFYPAENRSPHWFALQFEPKALAGQTLASVRFDNGDSYRFRLDVSKRLNLLRCPTTSTSAPTEFALETHPIHARAWFRLDRIPGMPNPRESLTNLFDVEIPVSAQEPSEFGNGWNPSMKGGSRFVLAVHLSSLLEVVCEATETVPQFSSIFNSGINELWIVLPPGNNQWITPRGLLESVTRADAGMHLTLDPDTHILHVERREPWLTRVRKWWNGRAPDWLDFG